MATIVNLPLYDPVLMGNPLYIWIILFLGAAVVLGAIAFKTEFLDVMAPVMGFRDSARSNKPQMIVQGMNGKMWLESVDHVANIFRSMTLPLMWIITVPVAGQMGKVNTSIVSDDWNIVHNIDIDYAIVEIAHRWNDIQEQIMKTLVHENTGLPYDEEEKMVYAQDNLIYNWDTFDKHLMNGDLFALVPEGVTLPPFRVVDLHEVKNYLPKWDAAHHAGYINQEVANRKGDEEKKGETLVKYAIVAGAILLICAVFSYLLITNAHPQNCG